MNKTTKITFAPDDGLGGGHVTQRHHHVQTDEDLDPPHVPHNPHQTCHSISSNSSSSTAARTINGYLLMERLEKLELGQDKLSSVILDLSSTINELSFNLTTSSYSKEAAFLGPKKCHKSISTQSDTGVQTEEKFASQSDIRDKEKEISRLRKELLRLRNTQLTRPGETSQHRASASSAGPKREPEEEASKEGEPHQAGEGGSEAHDFESESPLNLFIECFKKKYDVAVHPNDVAIFV